MIRKVLFAFILLFCSATAASATTCPSVSSSTTITNSCSTGIIWTGGDLTIGTSSTSISITKASDIAIEANSSSLGFITNIANNTIGSVATSNAIQNNSGSVIMGLYNYGSLTAENGVQNYGTITTLHNAGSINATTGRGIWNRGTISTLSNLGTMEAGAVDIFNQGVIITFNNYSTLGGSSAGFNNSGDLTTFNNIGSVNITSTDSGAGVVNNGYLKTLNNLGSIIVAGTNATSILNSSRLDELNNYGAITVYDGFGYSIYNNGTFIYSFNNAGSITAGSDGTGIYNDGASTIITLTNSGSITTGAGGVGINNNYEIITLTNTGSITAGSGGFGISNTGTIRTLNNSQGGNSSSAETTALTYTGVSPTNYNIGIISETHYGKLLMSSGATISNVGIYGSPLITSRTYAGVLTNDVTVTNLQNKYDNMTLSLVNNVTTGAFDLRFSGVSLMGTQLSLSNNAAALIPVYILQNSILVNSFTYDCNQFDSRNICISAGARQSSISSANGLSDNSALLIASYRPHPTYRIGAYIDQNLSVKNSGNTINLNNNIPVIGLFAIWNQNLNGTGTEIKLSAAYGQKSININRQIVGLSEFGSGSSSLNSQGAQLTAKYNFAINTDTIIAPYIGLRHTQNNMNGYTENTSPSLTAPLTYKALNTSTTIALAGLGTSYHFIPQAAIFASAGLETTLDSTNSQYSASTSAIAGLTPVNFNPNPVKTRHTAILGAYYNLGKSQQLGIAGIYRQEAIRTNTTTTIMATYTVGM